MIKVMILNARTGKFSGLKGKDGKVKVFKSVTAAMDAFVIARRTPGVVGKIVEGKRVVASRGL